MYLNMVFCIPLNDNPFKVFSCSSADFSLSLSVSVILLSTSVILDRIDMKNIKIEILFINYYGRGLK